MKKNILPQLILAMLIMIQLVPSKLIARPYFANESHKRTTSPPKNMADQTYTGTVIGTGGETLPGVSVSIKNTTKGVVTDKDGKFKITGVKDKSILVFSFIGYKKQEIVLGNQTVLTITLEEETNILDEVAVVSTGYGDASKKDYTGSVGAVNMKDFQQAPVRSFDEALAGRIAGVQVTSPDGQPGSTANIVIRGTGTLTGSTSPLFVIDGFIQEDAAGFNALNPSDIASIEVLKDASSTAIYGSRGANGVMIITTKRGKSAKPTITYNSFYGVQRVSNKMELLSPYEFVRLQNEIDPNFTRLNYFEDGKTLESYRDVEGINWQDKMYRDAPFQNHSFSLAGKNGKTSYLVSANYTDQKGLIVNSGFNRYQGRFVLDQEVSDKVKFGMTTNYGVTTSYGNVVNTQTYSGTGSTNDASYSLVYNIWTFRPISGKLSNEELENEVEDFGALTTDADRFNPYIQATNELNERQANSLSSNAYLEYKFLKGFRLRINGGLTLEQNESRRFYNSMTRSGSPTTRFGSLNGPNGSIANSGKFNYQNENLLFYDTKIGKDHSIAALIGMTIQKNTSNSRSFSAVQVPNEALGVNGLDEGIPLNNSVSSTLNSNLSYLGRLNYSYKSKYNLTFTMRADGSSKFRKENQWGYFPSGAIAWRFADEPFMEEIKNIVSDGKLRASYGFTGNNRVSDFATYATVTTPNNNRYYFNNSVIVGSAPSTLANPNLTWETASMFDVGLELGFFNNRLSLEVDYYRKKSFDLLLNAPVANTTGFSNSFQNVGDIENQGLEITLNSLNVKTKDFSWSTNFNISFNQNRLLRLANKENTLLTGVGGIGANTDGYFAYIAKVGEPVAQFHGFISDGLYQISDFDVSRNGATTLYALKDGVPYYGTRASIQPGDAKLKDLNNDGLINNSDNTIIGSPNPLHIGGFSNSFTYKGFDLGVFFQWSYGNQVYNGNRNYMENTLGGNERDLGINYFATYTDRWTFTNQDAKFPRVRNNVGGTRVFSTRNLEDASFIRLKTISVGYNVPKKWIKGVGITALRIYASAQNLKTWTNYQGPDPEVSIRNSALTPGFDFSPYPRAISAVAGINLTF